MELDNQELEATRNKKFWEDDKYKLYAPSSTHHKPSENVIHLTKQKECKYCELKKKINFNSPIYLLPNTEIVIEDNSIKIIEKNLEHNLWKNGKREIVKIEINYCPICGRKLV